MQSNALDGHLSPPSKEFLKLSSGDQTHPPASCPWYAVEARVLLPHPGDPHQLFSLRSNLLPVGADLLKCLLHPSILNPPNRPVVKQVSKQNMREKSLCTKPWLSTDGPLLLRQVDSCLYASPAKDETQKCLVFFVFKDSVPIKMLLKMWKVEVSDLSEPPLKSLMCGRPGSVSPKHLVQPIPLLVVVFHFSISKN